jgi:hypothetical protein
MISIDTDALKSGIDLRNLVWRYTTLAGRKEMYGPCPKCHGHDRFHVTRDWFFCRQCHPVRGDCIEFAMWINGQDFQAACEWLTQGHIPVRADGLPLVRSRRRPRLRPPQAQWQARARAFIKRSQVLLWQPKGKAGLEYLLERGLSEQIIRVAGLGYNLKDIHDAPEKWGVADKESIWLPGPGIVIPWLVEHEIHRVNIRLLQPRLIKHENGKESAIRYIGPAGWAGAYPLYNADALHSGKPAILVEGEFCALTLMQEASDLITAVATGSTESGRADKWLARLSACSLVLVAFDSEVDKGDKAAQFWLKYLPNAKRWRPLLKDVNDMHKAGLDIHNWVEAGLSATLPEAEIQAEADPARWVDPELAYAILAEFEKGNPLASWPVPLWTDQGGQVLFHSRRELLSAIKVVTQPYRLINH